MTLDNLLTLLGRYEQIKIFLEYWGENMIQLYEDWPYYVISKINVTTGEEEIIFKYEFQDYDLALHDFYNYVDNTNRKEVRKWTLL